MMNVRHALLNASWGLFGAGVGLIAYWIAVVPQLASGSPGLLWGLVLLSIGLGAVVMGHKAASTRELALSATICGMLRRAVEAGLALGSASGFQKSNAITDPIGFWSWMLAVEIAFWFGIGLIGKLLGRALKSGSP